MVGIKKIVSAAIQLASIKSGIQDGRLLQRNTFCDQLIKIMPRQNTCHSQSYFKQRKHGLELSGGQIRDKNQVQRC